MINLKQKYQIGVVFGAFLVALSIIIIIIGVSGAKSNPSANATIFPTSKGESTQAVIPWITDYQQALVLAQEQDKPVLIAFSASWCGYCQKMKKDTYPDSDVIATLDSFIPLMIDTDINPAVAVQYQVSGIPRYIILAPDGTQIESFVGFLEPKAFVAKLQNALQ
ncbi:MAG: thioredoxin family protein [Planctomycetes bacterium]|nr:thioredoxin family protein [Planctomycetota bacterium]